MASEERGNVTPWVGALITFVLGAVSGAAVPWALLILFEALPEADSLLVFLAWLMPLLAFVTMIATFGVLSARCVSRFGSSPFWPVGGGIAGVIFQVLVLVEIISNQE
jgi:hypothetical protein